MGNLIFDYNSSSCNETGKMGRRYSRDLVRFIHHVAPLTFFIRRSIMQSGRVLAKEERRALLALIDMLQGEFASISFEIHDLNKRLDEADLERQREKEFVAAFYGKDRASSRRDFKNVLHEPESPNLLHPSSL